MLLGVEVEEQLVDLVDDLGRAGVGAIDLVDHEDHRQVAGERLAQHESGLWQRAFGGVDEEDDAVDHRERALDLATEVGVAGGVDDVQRDVVAVARVVPDQRGVLGEDGDALLALEVAGVHDPVDELFVGAERTGLTQHRVDEGGLAVVDVGDDGEVADVRAMTHCSRSRRHRRRWPSRRSTGRAGRGRRAPREWSGRGGTRQNTLPPIHERTSEVRRVAV